MADIFSQLYGKKNPYFEALLREGLDTSPIRSPWQGASRLAFALLTGLETSDQDRKEKQSRALRMQLPGLEGDSPSPMQAAMSGSPMPGPMPAPSGPRPTEALTDQGDTIPLPRPNPLGQLSPDFRSKFADLRSAAGDQGVFFNAPEVGSLGNVRTPQQQAALFAQGRTAPGPVVTGTMNSNHLTGNALDVVPTEGTTPQQIGSMVSALIKNDPRFAGMRSGATFSNLYDPLHIEMNNGQEPRAPWPRVASAGGFTPGMPPQQASVPPPAAAPPMPNATSGAAPVQTAQASTAQPAQRSPVQIDPRMAQQIRMMLASDDPAIQQQGYALYNQFAKPREETRPLTDPKERARFGIQPTDTNPYQVDAKGEVKAINPQPFAVNVNQQGQSEFEKEYGQGTAKRALGVLESADKASGDFQRVQLLRGLLANIQTGKLTPATATVGAWAQSIGLDPAKIGINPSTPATAEAATSLINKFALSNIGAADGGIPANNFSEADREFILRLVPNIKNRPEANDIILTAKERETQLAMERADKWAEARAQGIGYEKFERGWRKELQQRNVYGDLVEKVKALKQEQSKTAPQGDPIEEEMRRRGLLK